MVFAIMVNVLSGSAERVRGPENSVVLESLQALYPESVK